MAFIILWQSHPPIPAKKYILPQFIQNVTPEVKIILE